MGKKQQRKRRWKSEKLKREKKRLRRAVRAKSGGMGIPRTLVPVRTIELEVSSDEQANQGKMDTIKD